MDTTMTNNSTQLLRHWVTVVDEHGREVLEARWFDPRLVTTAHAA